MILVLDSDLSLAAVLSDLRSLIVFWFAAQKGREYYIPPVAVVMRNNSVFVP